MSGIAIVTRNAIHGGVETMIALHQRYFEATVFVAGGHNRPETCPFPFTYIPSEDRAERQRRLASALRPFDAVIYHWLPEWAVEAVRESGRPSIEVVHRDDTADGDKTVPHVIVTHSEFLAAYLKTQFSREAVVIPHGLDISRFPARPSGPFIGGLTSYYLTKGIDLFLRAWARLSADFPDVPVRFYGAGDDIDTFKRIARSEGVKVEFLPAVSRPEEHISEFRLFVAPSRIEGMPFAVMEALASNIPVVCSDLPGMVEFNDAARRAGFREPLSLFRSEDVKDLAAKLSAALHSDSKPSSREYIAKRFSVEEHCRAYATAVGKAIAVAESGATVASSSSARFVVSPAHPFSKLEVEELKWLAYQSFRFRNGSLFSLLKKLHRLLAR